MTASSFYDVIIIGGGPVGCFLSALLSSFNVRALVIERESVIYPAPRAVAIDDATLRLISLAHPTLGSWFSGHVLRAPVDVRTGLPNANGWSFSLVGPHAPRNVVESGNLPDTSFFHQPTFEKYLRTLAFSTKNPSQGGGTLLERTVFSSLINDPCIACTNSGLVGIPGCTACRVQVDVDEIAGKHSKRRRLQARYVIGADGGASSVRRALGIAYEGASFAASPWLVIDIETEDAALAARWTAFNFVCNPTQPFVHVPLPGSQSGRRFEFALREGEDCTSAAATSPERVAALLAKAGVDVRLVRVIRAVIYTFHARVATQWRAGRALLVGDAAHCMPPFRGQGLCAGLADAANLAWKLASAVAADNESQKTSSFRRAALDTLLDSYQLERHAHVNAVTKLAVNMGRLIDVRSRPLAAMRDVVMGAVNACPLTRTFTKDPFDVPRAADDGFLSWPRVLPRGTRGCQWWWWWWWCSKRTAQEEVTSRPDARVGRRVPNFLVTEAGVSTAGDRLIDDTIWYLTAAAAAATAETSATSAHSSLPLWTLLISPQASGSPRALAALEQSVDSVMAAQQVEKGGKAAVLFSVLQLLPASGALARATLHLQYKQQQQQQRITASSSTTHSFPPTVRQRRTASPARMNPAAGHQPISTGTPPVLIVSKEAWWHVADAAVGDATAQFDVWFNGERASGTSCCPAPGEPSIVALLRPDGIVHSMYTCEELEAGFLTESAVLSLSNSSRHSNRVSFPLLSRRPLNRGQLCGGSSSSSSVTALCLLVLLFLCYGGVDL